MQKFHKLLAAVALACLLPGETLAQGNNWQKTWDETLVAARKEGKVVVIGSPDPVMRKEIIPAFMARYPGITVDYIATGSTAQAIGRVRTERAAGVYSVDVFLSGAGPSYNILYKEKMIDPLQPMLILPEVTDSSKWKKGAPWFMDVEGKYVLRLFSWLQSSIFVNADKVKPEEFRTAQDLLNPKWQGKIVTEPPSSSGSGGNQAAIVYTQLGADFTRKLYVDQKPVFSLDRRQFTDWLARGTYYICLTCRIDDITALQKEGFNLRRVYELEGLRTRLVSSPFMMSVANRPANPNAMRIFANWMATREAVEIYSRSTSAASLRTDVDESFLDPGIIPKPGIDYPDDASPQWRSVDKPAADVKVKAILQAAGR